MFIKPLMSIFTHRRAMGARCHIFPPHGMTQRRTRVTGINFKGERHGPVSTRST